MKGRKYKLTQNANTRYGTNLRRRRFVSGRPDEVRSPSPDWVVSSEVISAVDIGLAAQEKGLSRINWDRRT